LLRRGLITNYQLDRLNQGFRHGFFYGEYKVLYLVGAGTHPGAGVPGVLLSAETTYRCIAEDHGLVPQWDDAERGTVALQKEIMEQVTG